MSTDIDFYFDFVSPYAYLAANRIERLAAAHGRKVRWKPVLMTVLSKAAGTQLLPFLPMKWRYIQHDVARSARLAGIPFRWPACFPKLLLAPGRAMTWLAATHGDDLAAAFAHTCFSAFFGDGIDIEDKEVLAGIAAGLGVERDALLAALEDEAVKAAFKQGSEDAIAKGVFGVPFMIADGEPYWGFDRLVQLEQALRGERKAA
ncbi:2-hydroxychromene-2-carboxylate isomerase [Duganella sp. LX20W]|uniref:2-hydroxychromene-2-carboxylate isomerase n=1 Tax=Rugamonas brunnea TaxID=2758569 RepID=A0A7W2IEB6_9BURK|nr:2-hydroxychromene-2-carboxylate isomerase [Rugamonas brunnea]MBA5640155.1 2-hydroxychromene-2-carboxylate isomerase [Rugamonas brunnea]